MATTLTRPEGIPAEVIACTDKQLRSLVNTPFGAHALAEIEFRIANAEALAIAEAEAIEARRNTLISEGTTIMGIKVSYEDLLHLATLNVKKWYEMPEGNIVSKLVAEVATALEGIQSREANALKQAIAEAQQ